MSVRRSHFGTLSSGEEISVYQLNAGEFSSSWSDYGATWLCMVTPDSKGIREDILLGHSCLHGYCSDRSYFGSTVGRCANRIAEGRFFLENKQYTLAKNDEPNNLHGGHLGFSHRVWKTEIEKLGGADCLVFSLTSPDGEEGFPGNVEASVRVSLSSSGTIRIMYEARCDAVTPVNLTNHAYFNLAGEGRGVVSDHVLSIAASRYLEADKNLIPLPGPPRSVEGTRYDFRTPKRLGDYLEEGKTGSGFDTCFALDVRESDAPAAVLSHPLSGRILKTRTSMPGLQLYTANHFSGTMGKSGHTYARYGAVCLETQYFPDSPNRSDFPDCKAYPSAAWKSWTEYEFLL